MNTKLSIGYKKYQLGYKGYLKLSSAENTFKHIVKEFQDCFRLCPHDALMDAARARQDFLLENNITNEKLLTLSGYAHHTHVFL